MSNDMTLLETIERFDEGLKKAADRARILGKLQKNKDWNLIADQFDALRHNGMKIYKSKRLTHHEALLMADLVVERMTNG